MTNNIFIFILSLFLVLRGSSLATKYAAHLAESFNLSKYTIGFILVAIISILPETFIAISSAFQGMPELGLGTLFGSNVADLSFVFALIIAVSGRSIKVESKILKNNKFYPFLMLLPVILGLDGSYSRLEGMALILVGVAFYYVAFRNGVNEPSDIKNGIEKGKSFAMLLFGLALLLIGSHFVVTSTSDIAHELGVNPVLIGMLIVGLGTTIPEALFSIKSIKSNDDDLAVGDILGTVLADATVVVGIIATISPFAFPIKIIYITGTFMVVSSFLLFNFMRSGRTITRKEGYLLFIFWLSFVFIEFIFSR